MGSKALDFKSLRNAIASMHAALVNAPRNDLERDGVIKRFEYTFELCLKMIRRVLLQLGRDSVSASPKPLFRAAVQEGWITQIDPWFRFLEARNFSSHTYNETNAAAVFEVAKDLPEAAEDLLQKLESASNNE